MSRNEIRRASPLTVGDLHRPQDVQHDAVGDGDREGAVLVGSGEEREPVGVEQRAAVGGHAQVLERRAAEEGLAGGQQPVPGQGGGVEGLLASPQSRVPMRRSSSRAMP